MRTLFVFLVLSAVKIISQVFYRHRLDWVGEPPADWWKRLRILAVLNHTSLYEPLLVGFAPFGMLWDLAKNGVLPVAEKTMKRKAGLFFRCFLRHVVVVTRQRDRTWQKVLELLDDQALVMILPEGRMKRPNGLDSNGRPMTVRGGIADILGAMEKGRLLLVYSGGLHHIQSPGELLPRIFKPIHAQMELLEIASYSEDVVANSGGNGSEFKRAVMADLERRRDAYCPPDEPRQQPDSAASS